MIEIFRNYLYDERMQSKKEGIKFYYEKRGAYLREHARFLQEADVEKDVVFLVRALGLKKSQNILDIACGQGRHIQKLVQKGYSVDGVDFSVHLLSLAKKLTTAPVAYKPILYKANVTKLALKKKYNRAYWFFSDLANIDIQKALLSISRNLAVGGRLLLDTDNIFRLIGHLSINTKSDLAFDATRLELIDARHNLIIPYPVLPMWRMWLDRAGFRIERVIGDYQFHPYTITSQRLILVVKKIA